MKNHQLLTLFMSIGLLFVELAFAADFERGKKLYHNRGCVGCHGDKVGSRLQGYPSLVGMSVDYVASEMNKYRNGVRKDPTMTAMAAGLSDQEIQDLALYISRR